MERDSGTERKYEIKRIAVTACVNYLCKLYIFFVLNERKS